MAEFIEREKALEECDWYANEFCECEYAIMPLKGALENLPAADVWEVVHCADCVHAEESLVSGCVYCNEMERARIKEGFCAWGERKTNDG